MLSLREDCVSLYLCVSRFFTSCSLNVFGHKSTYILMSYVNICKAASSLSIMCHSQPNQPPSKAAKSKSLTHHVQRACMLQRSSEGYVANHNYTTVPRTTLCCFRAAVKLTRKQPYFCFDRVSPRPYALCQEPTDLLTSSCRSSISSHGSKIPKEAHIKSTSNDNDNDEQSNRTNKKPGDEKMTK